MTPSKILEAAALLSYHDKLAAAAAKLPVVPQTPEELAEEARLMKVPDPTAVPAPTAIPPFKPKTKEVAKS